MSKYVTIIAAAVLAAAATANAAQARTTAVIDEPAAAATLPQAAPDTIRMAALNAYLRLKGQKQGSVKAEGGEAVAAPHDSGDRKKRAVRGRGGIIVED